MIDTLKFARSFEQAGFATSQAEALTAALAEMNSDTREDLATKTDLQMATAATKADLQVAVAQLKNEIVTSTNAVKWQTLWMLFGSQLFVIATVVAVNNIGKIFS